MEKNFVMLNNHKKIDSLQEKNSLYQKQIFIVTPLIT
jgi:hypothetical protein